eukprot:CAMPEP_0118870256 /NCGR_PEP_ID=MMETSP1163-20130328/13294_1 /TAXON_ID=124430 /ORGANISM="Phaeomonas parva, Strain CCMP2877" /LENGTH=515 /DNA_ID=CAMNT_0006805239 /DNA_START=157 /DNA_END=1700 /DNA_ORIENTATION=-
MSSGNPEPGDCQRQRLVPLTLGADMGDEDRRAIFVHMCKQRDSALESLAGEDWKDIGTVNGVEQYSNFPEGLSLAQIRGDKTTEDMPGAERLFQMFTLIDNSEALRKNMAMIDELFADGALLGNFNKADIEKFAGKEMAAVQEVSFDGKEWVLADVYMKFIYACFLAPGPLWNRDAAFTSFMKLYKPKRDVGRNSDDGLVIITAASMPDGFVPEVEGRVRAKIHGSGYFFRVHRASEDFPVRNQMVYMGKPDKLHVARTTYLCCMDPGGIIPSWIKAIVATKQAQCAHTCPKRLAEVYRAAMELQLPRPSDGMLVGKTAQRLYVRVPINARRLRVQHVAEGATAVRVVECSLPQMDSECILAGAGSCAALEKRATPRSPLRRKSSAVAAEDLGHFELVAMEQYLMERHPDDRVKLCATPRDLLVDFATKKTLEPKSGDDAATYAIEFEKKTKKFFAGAMKLFYKIEYQAADGSWIFIDDDSIGVGATLAVEAAYEDALVDAAEAAGTAYGEAAAG